MPCQPCFSRVVFFFSHFSRETKWCSWSKALRVGVLLCGRAAQRCGRPRPPCTRALEGSDFSRLCTRVPPALALCTVPSGPLHLSAGFVPECRRKELDVGWHPVPPRPAEPGGGRWEARQSGGLPFTSSSTFLGSSLGGSGGQGCPPPPPSGAAPHAGPDPLGVLPEGKKGSVL